MTEKSIVLRAHEVRGIIENRQTQIRRIVKLRSKKLIYDLSKAWVDGADNSQYLHVPYRHIGDTPDGTRMRISCPYGQLGDQLYVRETFNADWCDKVIYRADTGAGAVDAGYEKEPKWTPSIHMPRKYSRIMLEIKSVRVERLQDISIVDCHAEGAITDSWIEWREDVTNIDMPEGSTIENERDVYSRLWESINGYDTWDVNPWVWVLEFERVK